MSAPKAPTQFRSPLAIAICIVATLGLTAADLVTKDWAMSALSEPVKMRPDKITGVPHSLCRDRLGDRCRLPAIVLIEGYLEFHYAENTGAAFGIGRDWPQSARVAIFGLAALLAAIGLIWMFIKGSGNVLFAWSVPLVVSGAVGNLVDRARLNFVVDFIRFHVYDKFEYPTFNVADITIVVGVALMILDGFKKPAPKKKAAEEAAASETEEPKSERRPKGSSAAKKKKKAKKKAEDRSSADA